MITRALLGLAAIPAFCFSLLAQELAVSHSATSASFRLNQASAREMVEGRAALEKTGSFRTLSGGWQGAGPLTLVDGRRFSFPSAFGWVEAPPGDFLPAFTAEELPRVVPVEALARERGGQGIDLLHKFDYVGGEVGVFYGRSTGKFKREVEAGYIFGEVVDGNTHISAGASYEHSSGRDPRVIGR